MGWHSPWTTEEEDVEKSEMGEVVGERRNHKVGTALVTD